MKYVIHSNVIFDTTEYLLTLLNDAHTSIKLSNSAGRILEELIKYRKTCEPITREHLFSKVWRNHGLAPSHGNLNQQISLIRKSLNLLGINPASIITIPKRGLKLNDQISIQIIDEKPLNNPIHLKPTTKNINNQHHKIPWLSEPILPAINIKYTFVLLILIITILSISTIYFYIKDKNLKKLYLCRQMNSCNICTFHQTPNLECNDLSFKFHDNKNNKKTQKNNNLHNYNYDPYIKIYQDSFF